MNIAIVKYNAGNVYSVVNAFKRMGVEPQLTDDAEQLAKADRVIFPGQGEASSAMQYLRARRLDEVIRDLKQPVLGICIGQQLLCRHSDEGNTDCIGVFDVDVRRFSPIRHEDKVPCMGWNELHLAQNEKLEMRNEKCEVVNGHSSMVNETLFGGLGDHPYVYFVHSFYVPVCENTAATADYILPYSAALQKDNFYTCQFHPEKSGKVGESILRNFLNIK